MEHNDALHRLQQDLQLRGYSQSTERIYMREVRLFLSFCSKPAQELTEEDVRQYILHRQSGGLSKSTLNTYQEAIRFFFGVTLNRTMNYLQVPRLKENKNFPVILSREEIGQLFQHCGNLKHKAMLSLAYGSGLRVSEICSLMVPDIDSKGMRVFVRNSKRNKDRYTILLQWSLKLLRDYWRQYRPKDRKGFLFPGWRDDAPLTTDALECAMKKWLHAAAIDKAVSVHSLRHAFATHLLEDGVNIFTIKDLMGHSSISSTTIYLHLVNPGANATSPADRLYDGC